MRIILYTGKGGVGKTSIAAETAAQLADKGKKVLIMSTDQAHSLSDAFDIKLHNEPTLIEENLYGMELDTVEENEKACGKVMKYIKELTLLKQEDSIEVEELLVFPGLEELLALLKIEELYNEGLYDVLVVDCAPTGETMSLLKFPDLFRGWMEKFFPMKRKGAKIAKPVVEKTMKIPMPDDDFFDEFERLYERVAKLQHLMQNKDIVSLRIVTTPEKIVIREAQRSFSYLHLYDYNVDAIIINKIFPNDSMKGYFSKWQQLQGEAIHQVEEGFKGIPILKQELQQTELRGYHMLCEAGNLLFKEKEADAVWFREKIYTVVKTGRGYALKIHMPFVDKKELGLSQKGDELTLTIKNEKRSLILPTKLLGKEILQATYKENDLQIYFE